MEENMVIAPNEEIGVEELEENLTGEAEQQQEAPAQEAEPEPAEEQPEADDNAGLMAMKINELRELAKGSGVALPKNATKAQIIELLMGSDE